MKPVYYFRFLLTVFGCTFLIAVSVAQVQTTASGIDSLLKTKFKNEGPGAVFLVAKNGNMIYQKAFGEANIELHVPMKPEHIFEIGSMTKQFTAVSIMLLMEQGKLQLTDEITAFIPDYPVLGKKITIHHLLTHTSGIKDYTRLKTLREKARQDMEPIELIDLFKNEPMDFEPGEKFMYNNSGYIILGYIIESLSGKTYADFVEQNIFAKIGMSSSLYGSHSKIITNRVSGYQDKKGLVNNDYISLSLPYAAGSIMSSVEDMAKWQASIKNNILVKKETIEKVFTNYTLNNGEKINYGYGWHIKNISGSISYEHGGSIFGFKSMGVYLPDEDVYVIGLTNCDCNSPTEVTKEIAALVIQQTHTKK